MKRKRINSLDDFLFGVDDFEKEFNEIFENMISDFKGFRPQASGKPVVYGFSMQVGPDGKPKFEEFGNVQKGKMTETREPLADVINGKEEITLIAELPGVDKKDLHIKATKDSVHITVTDEERPYEKLVQLPQEVEADSAKANLKNGVLELVLKKKKSEKLKEVRVA